MEVSFLLAQGRQMVVAARVAVRFTARTHHIMSRSAGTVQSISTVHCGKCIIFSCKPGTQGAAAANPHRISAWKDANCELCEPIRAVILASATV